MKVNHISFTSIIFSYRIWKSNWKILSLLRVMYLWKWYIDFIFVHKKCWLQQSVGTNWCVFAEAFLVHYHNSTTLPQYQNSCLSHLSTTFRFYLLPLTINKDDSVGWTYTKTVNETQYENSGIANTYFQCFYCWLILQNNLWNSSYFQRL